MSIKKSISIVIISILLITLFMPIANAASYSRSIYNATIARIMDQAYTGNYIKPDVVIRYNGTKLKKGTDYTLTYSNNKYVGTATVKITGKGKYTGTTTTTFNIIRTGNSYNDYYYNDNYYNNYYDDYYYNDNYYDNYYDDYYYNDYYYDEDISITKATVSSVSNRYYTGRYIEPSVTVRYNGRYLEEGEDYTLSYSNNKNVGTAKIKIKGIGNFYGTKTVSFKILSNSVDISRATISSIPTQYYTGKAIKPDVTVRYNGRYLEEGEDYTVSYSNNKNVGTATVKVKGKGDFDGTITRTFRIVSRSISISRATVSNILNQEYTGKYIKPTVTVKYNGETLRKNTDYTVSYSNNKNVGTATVKITGKGNYTGTITKTFKIVDSRYDYDNDYDYNYDYNYGNKTSMSRVTVSNILNQMYTGNYIKPSVTVRYNGKRLRSGTDYTVSYSNNRNVGTATVKITGRGSYTGTITKTFKIVNR